MKYIYQNKDWPNFIWDMEVLAEPLANLRHNQGLLIGRMQGLGFELRSEAVLQTLTQDVLKSSEIEGEIFDKDQVRSSIAQRLGMEIAGLIPADRDVEGVVEMMLDATQSYDKLLDATRLYAWHATLFPTGRSGMNKIIVGGWRDDAEAPMQVVSGPYGRERVHYQAPDAAQVDDEMEAFLDWFASGPDCDPVLKAGLAHLWFVTIHPFEDGNGRMARAIADMALARSEKSSQRFYSMSAQIRQDRKAYYEMLEAAQKGGLDVTKWLEWFLACLESAIAGAEETLSSVFAKSRFWETHKDTAFNERQRDMLNRLLNGFFGKLTSSKWAAIQKCSQDTAGRDIKDLLERDILIKEPGGGRSTSYSLVRW